MRIDTNLIIDMFKQASERIIKLISDVLKKMKGSNLEMIVLVGGFSGCKVIQDNIKSFFPSYRVIVPEDTELAVLKGAVLFGHRLDYIAPELPDILMVLASWLISIQTSMNHVGVL
jgi:molecular chaperone DnaK (HSP70)